MSHKKPEPISPNRKPNECPVCGKASYSAAGIHPQCAVTQADNERSLAQKQAASKSESKSPAAKKLSRWQKSCPKCKASLHVRKKTCDCGYTFSETKQSSD